MRKFLLTLAISCYSLLALTYVVEAEASSAVKPRIEAVCGDTYRAAKGQWDFSRALGRSETQYTDSNVSCVITYIDGTGNTRALKGVVNKGGGFNTYRLK
jgi:hypothetical protein